MSQRYPDLPARMAALPVDHRGFPVPWFVAWVDGQPQFPVADADKFEQAIRYRKCWVCGGQLGKYGTYVIGPMCAVNRTSSEPPSHLDCAQFSARNCPFLTRPRMKRVGRQNLPIGSRDPAGEMIERNPGVALVWTSTNGKPHRTRKGLLFDIGDPTGVEWYAHGRPATREEVLVSIETGLPLLRDMADRDPHPEAANLELNRYIDRAMLLVPA